MTFLLHYFNQEDQIIIRSLALWVIDVDNVLLNRQVSAFTLSKFNLGDLKFLLKCVEKMK